MIPWGLVAKLFIKGVQSVFEPDPEQGVRQHRPPRRPDYDFETHMQCLARQTSTPLTFLRPDRAVFRFVDKTGSFLATLIFRGSNIGLTLGSNIRFKGGIPPTVRETVDATVEDLRQSGTCDYKAHYCPGGDGDFIYVATIGPAAELDSGIFLQNLGAMAIVLSHIDAWLIQEGHGRSGA
jgi:hypothetical protein